MGGGSTTSTQKVDMGPWAPQQPYLEGLFAAANTMATQNALQPWQGTTVSPFSPAQSQGYQNVINTAAANGSAVAPTNAMLTATANGNYLDPSSNPWLASTFKNAAQGVTDAYQTATAPQTDSQFEMAGRYGSGAANQAQNQNQLALGRTLDTLANGIYGTNYQNERTNQLKAGAIAPSLDQAQYIDPTAMANAGGAQQEQAQKELTGQYNQFMQNQMLPWQTAQLYQGLISGNYGQSGTVQQQTPYYSNPIGSAFGGLMSLGGLAGQLGWSPFAAGSATAGGFPLEAFAAAAM